MGPLGCRAVDVPLAVDAEVVSRDGIGGVRDVDAMTAIISFQY